MRRFVLAAVVFGAASAAHAADLPDLPILRGAFTEGLTTAKVNWQGGYVGAEGGFGTSNMNFTGSTQTIAARLLFGTAIESSDQVSSWPVGGGKASVHGSGFGAFAGYNSQWDDVVLGVEINYLHGSFAATKSDSMTRIFTDSTGTIDTVTYQSTGAMAISDMATLRGRAGYAFGCFLPYMFGGVALGEADIARTAHIFGNQFNALTNFNQNFDLSATDSQNSHLIYGYAFGLGTDVALYSGLFLRAEWQYVRFTSSIDTSVNTFHLGLGYKF